MTRLLHRCLLILLLAFAPAGVLLSPTQAIAQQTLSGPDYETWERTAQRAEVAVDAGRASSTALETLRNELVGWRQQFTDAQAANKSAIATTRAQIEALGPVPEAGTEAEDIAGQRAELNRRLARLQAPVKTAELAYSRADGLIKGIDRIIRDRQTEELLQLGPTPLNPANWRDGLAALFGSLGTVRNEIVTAWANPVQRAETKQNLPGVLLGALIGLVLMVRGRRWSEWLTVVVLRARGSGAGRWIASFVISLGELVLPFVGLFILVEAVYATGLIGLRGDVILGLVPPTGFIFLLARWLAMRIFPRHELRDPPLQLDIPQRRAGRWYGGMLGLVVAMFFLLKRVAEIIGWSEEATVTILFVAMILAGLLLLQIARLLIAHSRAGRGEGATEGQEEMFRDQLARILARALQILAIVAPALAAVGYFKAALALMLPSLLSLLLLGALLVLQRVITELYVLLSGNRDGAGDSLVPTLMGFLLVLLSVPLFALIWGARVADLTELWTRFTEGVSVGGTTISPTIFLTLAVVFVIGYMLTRLLQGALRNSILPKTRIDVGGRNAIVSGVGYLGIFLAAVIAITSAGIDLSNVALVAGALSVGIGFGLQNIVSNFVSGIILLIERPISEGDWIEVGGVHGTVRDISVRSTRIETFDRSDVIVPNADLVSGRVTNYTRGNTVGRVIVPVGVAYGTDTRRVEAILQEIGNAHPMALANPAPAVIFRGFGADSMDFEIRAILRDVNWVMSVQSDMNHEIARRFAQEGIEIPFAQRDVWLRNPEVLQPAEAAAKPGPAPDIAPESKSKKPRRRKSGKGHLDETDFTPPGDGDADGGGR